MSHWISPAAETPEGLEEFKVGLARLRQGQRAEAMTHIRRALEVEPRNPFYLSYAGLLAALNEARYGDAELLCRQALELKWNHAQLYLNLADVYQHAGRKSEAIETLEKGLRSAGRDFRLRRALERLGVRRAPVLRWLDRGHPMNRALGRLRHRLTANAQMS
jgi:Flp pilus assembly protein TadD